MTKKRFDPLLNLKIIQAQARPVAVRQYELLDSQIVQAFKKFSRVVKVLVVVFEQERHQ